MGRIRLRPDHTPTSQLHPRQSVFHLLLLAETHPDVFSGVSLLPLAVVETTAGAVDQQFNCPKAVAWWDRTTDRSAKPRSWGGASGLDMCTWRALAGKQHLWLAWRR